MNLGLREELKTEKLIWTIREFRQIPPLKGFSVKSSIIHYRHARKGWRFVLYPSSQYDPNYMAFFFHKGYFIFDPFIYDCLVSIGGSNRKPVESLKFQCQDLQRSILGMDVCFRRDSIERLPKGSVTVQCEITEVSFKSFYPSIVDDFENLSSELTLLYHSGMFNSDLKVRIQQYDFYLHTCVLYARCRRLTHVFGYESFNKMPKFVEINNINPYHFQMLITYLYSGKLEDIRFSLQFFKLVDKLKLQSFKQLVYEKVQEYHAITEIAKQTLTITWNINEILFSEEETVPFVQMFELKCMNRLAVQVGLIEYLDGEKYIDISFKVFSKNMDKLVLMSCVVTLFSNDKVCVYEKESQNIRPCEEWYFPPFIKLSDILESYSNCDTEVRLTAEISLSDECTAYSSLHTKTRLFTQKPPVVFPERLGVDMGRLLSSKLPSRFKKHDIYLKSIDNHIIPAHKAILWFRWPALRGNILMAFDEHETYLPLNLLSDEIQILIFYIYTGSLPYFDYATAEKLLQANSRKELPPYIVKKCEYLLYERTR